MVQEILNKKNKEEISQSLERSFRFALNKSENCSSEYDKLNMIK